MTTTTQNFGSLTVGTLSFSNIIDTETDTGTTTSFLASGPVVVGNTDIYGLSGLDFAFFDAGVSGANSVETNVFTYNVTSTDATQLIDSIDSAYQSVFTGNAANLGFTAIEQVFDTSGNLIATQTINSLTNDTAQPLTFSRAYASVNVRVTWTMDTTGGCNVTASAAVSGIQQNFGTIATSQLCSIGDIVFLDTNKDGLEDAGFDGGPGVKGVTVELLDSTGTKILATTTTDASGRYSFTNLVAGTYEVEFVKPTGFAFTTQGVGGNPAINSSANQLTGITGPITLTAGQANHNVEAGLVSTTGGGGGGGTLSIVKTEDLTCVSTVGQVIHYTISVTNTGLSALTGVQMSDPNATDLTFVSASDTNHNGKIDVGETWQWTAIHTVTQADIDAGTTSCVPCATGDHGVPTTGDHGVPTTGDHGVPTTGDHGVPTTGDHGVPTTGDHGVPTTGDHGHTTPGDPGVGTIVNTATVFTNQTGSQSATVAATALKHAALTLTKTEDISKVDHAGQVVHYTITAKNEGNATLTNVVFRDDTASNVTFLSASDTNHDGKLSVGETWSWTADHTVTQAEIDAAPSHAVDAGGIVTASSTVSVGCVTGDPGHVVVDDHGHDSTSDHGHTSTTDDQGSTTTSDHGHTTTTSDHGHTSSTDDQGNTTNSDHAHTTTTSDHGDATASDHGHTTTADDHGHTTTTSDHGHTTTADDHGHTTGGDNQQSGPGHIVNTAAISTAETGATSVTVVASVDKHAALKIVKTEDISSVTAVGQVIHYQIAVQNTGNTALTGVAMSDPNGQHLTFLATSDTNGNGRLDLNETWVWTADHTVTAAELSSGKNDDDKSFRDGHGNQLWGDAVNPSSYTNSNADDGHGEHNDDSGSICGGSGSGFIVNTATVTTDETSAASASVSAVIVTAPTVKLDDDYGEAARVEFRYNPSDTVSANVLSAGLGSYTGHNTQSMAFIEVSTKANAFDTGAKIYFEGSVAAGGTFFAESSVDLNKASHLSGLSNFDGSAGSLYIHIFKDLATFNAHGASLQDATYDVSGGHGGLHLNDQIASLKLVGYEGMTGHGGYVV